MDDKKTNFYKKLPPLKKKFEPQNLELNKYQKLENICLNENNEFVFINKNGTRDPFIFKSKEHYVQKDVFAILENLDKLWEKNIIKNESFDYIG